MKCSPRSSTSADGMSRTCCRPLASWGMASLRSWNEVSPPLSSLYSTGGKRTSKMTPLYTARPRKAPTSWYSRHASSVAGPGLRVNQWARVSGSSVNMPKLGLKISRTSSWKNSLVTPPSSRPSSSIPALRNFTRRGFLRSRGLCRIWWSASSSRASRRMRSSRNSCQSSSPSKAACSRELRISWRFCRLASPCRIRVLASGVSTKGIWHTDARGPLRASDSVIWIHRR
mmetsp:Transcript_15475/g.43866  ORF Transcript_15475/g.43866 Transcript_15475/m.43866 type:complete len:229 (+) Transcript_15475:625-1311(+)